MAENINIDFMPNRNTPDIQRVTTVEDYLKLFTDRTKFCFASVYDDFADMGKRIEYLENYSLAMPSSVDLTVENAVILQEKESQQVIHNFTKTHYVKGNNVGYGGVGNSIVLSGYIANADVVLEPDKWYSEISFPKAKRRNTSNWGDLEENVAFYCRVVSISANATSFVVGHSINGVEAGHTSNFTSVGPFGLGLRFYNITAPDDEFEYGSADVYIDGYYETTSGYNSRYDYRFRLPFQSEAEFNAAIGLTNTPIELIELKDFQYLMPESQIIVDKALSPDSDNVIANSAVAKGLELKADKETVENLSLVVESKADIIEVDALAEIVNSKADSTDVQSIAQTVESKAETSELTTHTGNTANPHNVTKSQIGLSKVENKSSADILSELEIGGRNYIYNSNFSLGTNGWILDTGCIVDTTTLINGNPALKILVEGATSNVYIGGFSNRRLSNNGFSAKKGEIITFSCDYYISSDKPYDSTFTAQFSGIPEGSTASSIFFNANLLLANIVYDKWSKFVMTFEMPDTYTNMTVNNYITRNGLIWLGNFKVEKGNKATAWTPAPEDTETRITSLEERVSALEAAILSLGGET